ncbi:MAG TPA: hypothetical protein PL169_28450, partial [Leptospiraceae bacterium]|nr:hypothetical protein [Leptospiraceae bacterium]
DRPESRVSTTFGKSIILFLVNAVLSVLNISFQFLNLTVLAAECNAVKSGSPVNDIVLSENYSV